MGRRYVIISLALLLAGVALIGRGVPAARTLRAASDDANPLVSPPPLPTGRFTPDPMGPGPAILKFDTFPAVDPNAGTAPPGPVTPVQNAPPPPVPSPVPSAPTASPVPSPATSVQNAPPPVPSPVPSTASPGPTPARTVQNKLLTPVTSSASPTPTTLLPAPYTGPSARSRRSSHLRSCRCRRSTCAG